MLFLAIYVLCILLVCYNICKLIIVKKLDNDLLFLISTNCLLNISTSLFFGYYNNYLLSLISASLLLIFAILLLFSLKKVWGYFSITILPYTYLTLFIFFYILFYTI